MNKENKTFLFDRYTERLIGRIPELSRCRQQLTAVCGLLADTFEKGNKLLLCGNGGSCADAEHIAGELLKGFMRKRPIPKQEKAAFSQYFGEEGAALADTLQRGLPTMGLHSHIGLLTAFANDVEPLNCYAQQLYALGAEGDCLLGISTGGNAGNVKSAFMAAKVKKIKTVLLTGAKKGSCMEYADLAICVPATETYLIQEFHLPVYHMICQALEEYFYGEEE